MADVCEACGIVPAVTECPHGMALCETCLTHHDPPVKRRFICPDCRTELACEHPGDTITGYERECVRCTAALRGHACGPRPAV